jgi:hypothetical protein
MSANTSSTQNPVNQDLSIESMRSQEFGVGVFIFLIISILFFSLIVGTVLKAKQSESKMRTGEKVLFASIILGILIAIIFGAMQMLSGVLF